MNTIKPKTIAHGIMCVFAFASLFNIEDFIYTLHANSPLAWAVAIALSTALVVFSALLAEMKWGGRGFWIMLAVVGGLTIVSGAIQGASYAAHTNPIAGWLMGFSLPLFGELGASLALSVYAKESQARSMEEAQQQLSDGVRRHIIESLSAIDRSKIDAQVNRATSYIAKELIDSAIHDMVSELRENRAQVVQLSVQQNVQIEDNFAPDNTNNTPNLAILDSQNVQNTVQQTALERANEQRQQAKLGAMRIVMSAYRNDPDASLRDVAALVERSPQTISNWLKELEKKELVTVNGSVHVHGEL